MQIRKWKNRGRTDDAYYIIAIFLLGLFYFSAGLAHICCPNLHGTTTSLLAYCEKTYKNAPKCMDACKKYLAECLSTGCWENNVTAQRCGFGKQ